MDPFDNTMANRILLERSVKANRKDQVAEASQKVGCQSQSSFVCNLFGLLIEVD